MRPAAGASPLAAAQAGDPAWSRDVEKRTGDPSQLSLAVCALHSKIHQSPERMPGLRTGSQHQSQLPTEEPETPETDTVGLPLSLLQAWWHKGGSLQVLRHARALRWMNGSARKSQAEERRLS